MSQLLQKVKVLVPNVHEIVQLGRKLRLAEDNFDRQMEHLPEVDKYLEYLKDPHLKKVNKEFFEYFNGLTHDDTAIILSIMYIGRDEKDPDEYERRRQEFEDEGYEFDEPEDGIYDSPQKKVFDYLKYIKVSKTLKEEIISIMMEKADLSEYLLDGLHILRL